MFKRIGSLIVIGFFCFFVSGCALLNAAISAAAAYAIYEATKK